MVTNSASGKSKTGNFEIQLAYIIRIKEIYSVVKVYTSAYNRIPNIHFITYANRFLYTKKSQSDLNFSVSPTKMGKSFVITYIIMMRYVEKVLCNIIHNCI